MPTMPRALILIAAVSLAGCAASGTQIQADCERSYSNIGDVVQCTRTTIAQKNPAKLQDSKAKLYLLRGEQLAAEVSANRMSNLDARVAWQKLYVELWEPSPQEVAARLQLVGQSMQRQANDTAAKPVATTTCTSGPFLGQIRTDCKTQ